MHRAIVLLLALVTLTACSRHKTDQPSAPVGATGNATTAPAGTLTKVTLKLNWFPETEHGGYYEAQARGFYRDAGLDVTIEKGGSNTPVEVDTAAGRVQFGITNGDKLLAVRAANVPLVALMAPFQTFPRCIIVHDSSPIKTLADLHDTTLVANSTKPYVAFLQQQYGLKGMKFQPYSGGMATFLGQPTYAIQGYSTSEPLIIARHHVKSRTLMLADAGYNPYASVLITNETMLDQQPDVVRRMVQASQKGWIAYLANPAATNKLIQKFNPDLDDETLAYGADHLKPLMLTDAVKTGGFGTMSEARWTKLRDQLLAAKVIDAYPEPITKAFTTAYLDPKQTP